MSSASSPEARPPDEPTPKLKSAFNIVLDALIVCSILTAVLAGFAVLLWTLVEFGQNGKSNQTSCAPRETENGFRGSAEFYGLGIRLGVYFQWWASLIANLFLPNDWRAMFAAYLVFSTALIVALIMSTFQHACTFTTEIIVVLFIFWGGYIGLLHSTRTAIAAVQEMSDKVDFGTGLSYALAAPTWIGIAFSIWFWLRLATAGEVDFTPTPGGTSYFMFARVSPDTKAASRFIVVVCFYFAWNTVTYVIGFIAGYLWCSLRDLYRLFFQKDRRPMIESRHTGLSPGESRHPGTEQDQSQQTGLSQVESQHSVTEQYQGGRFKSYTKIGFGIFSAISLIYSTVAIELTLVWNSVSDVYSVASTEQVIPLIAGIGLLINALWHLFKIYLGEEASESTNNGYELRELEDGMNYRATFQRDDATWR